MYTLIDWTEGIQHFDVLLFGRYFIRNDIRRCLCKFEFFGNWFLLNVCRANSRPCVKSESSNDDDDHHVEERIPKSKTVRLSSDDGGLKRDDLKVHTAFHPFLPATGCLSSGGDARTLRLPAIMTDPQLFTHLGITFQPPRLVNYFPSLPFPPPQPFHFRHPMPVSGTPYGSSVPPKSTSCSHWPGLGYATKLLAMGVESLQSFPDFVDLPLRDQVTLLEESWSEIFILMMAQLNINPGECFTSAK